ncbi:MAG: hypothetical protein AB1659_09455 [Thermodesulfobacteriota bacterium]
MNIHLASDGFDIKISGLHIKVQPKLIVLNNDKGVKNNKFIWISQKTSIFRHTQQMSRSLLKECHDLKPFGIAGFTEPAASSGTGHTAVLPSTLFLASSANSTIAQFRFNIDFEVLRVKGLMVPEFRWQ